MKIQTDSTNPFFSILVLVALLLLSACSEQEKRVLVFTKTAGFHHNSITTGIVAIQKLGA
jgi:uncharacterized lipoprotein YajG